MFGLSVLSLAHTFAIFICAASFLGVAAFVHVCVENVCNNLPVLARRAAVLEVGARNVGVVVFGSCGRD